MRLTLVFFLIVSDAAFLILWLRERDKSARLGRDICLALTHAERMEDKAAVLEREFARRVPPVVYGKLAENITQGQALDISSHDRPGHKVFKPAQL